MTQYAKSSINTNVVIVQSADPTDLQNMVNATFANIARIAQELETTFGIAGLTLAGGGDGHTFIVTITYAEATDIFGNFLALGADPSPAAVRCYLGADAEALETARAAAGVPDPVNSVPYVLVDEQCQGAAKGTRFMGMSVYQLATVPEGVTSLAARANKTTLDQDISAATPTLVLFQFIEPDSIYSLEDTNSTIQYNGFQSFIAAAQASVTVVARDNAVAVTVKIIRDPLGTPVVVGSMTASLLSTGDAINIGVQALIGLFQATGFNKYAVQVTTDKASTVMNASILIIPTSV